MKVLGTEFLKSIPGIIGIHFDKHAPYEVIQKGDCEIRKYAPMTLVTIASKGTHEVAINKAFTYLAKYIFTHDIPMTVPVFQELIPNGVRLSFYLSEDDDLPQPKNPDIFIQHLPERLIAAYAYSGINTPAPMLEAKSHLLELVAGLKNYHTCGEVFWAQYDSPLTIPFLRKNEALIKLESHQS